MLKYGRTVSLKDEQEYSEYLGETAVCCCSRRTIDTPSTSRFNNTPCFSLAQILLREIRGARKGRRYRCSFLGWRVRFGCPFSSMALVL